MMNGKKTLAEVYYELESLALHDDLVKSISDFTESAQFDKFLYTTIPDYFSHRSDIPPPVVTTNFDSSWMDYYIYKRFDLNDAGFNYCTVDSDPFPFFWSRRARYLSKEERHIHKMSREALGELVTIPVQNSLGAISVVSFSLRSGTEEFYKLYENNESQILQYVYAFNARMLNLHAPYYGHIFSPTLTSSEKDILKYLANGYTRKEISMKRVKAQGTIDKQINSAMVKLRARNIVHAVVLALKWNLLK